MNLTTYIPIEKAALRAGVAPEALTRAVQDGKIRAVNVGDNDVAVSEDDLKVLAIGRDESLEGHAIRATDAAEKYGVSHANLTHWTDYGYINVIKRGPSLLILDEADVKQAATIFKKAKTVTGSSTKAGWVLKRSMQYLHD
jgi:predicted site-specific integrase-resolvase